MLFIVTQAAQYVIAVCQAPRGQLFYCFFLTASLLSTRKVICRHTWQIYRRIPQTEIVDLDQTHRFHIEILTTMQVYKVKDCTLYHVLCSCHRPRTVQFFNSANVTTVKSSRCELKRVSECATMCPRERLLLKHMCEVSPHAGVQLVATPPPHTRLQRYWFIFLNARQ